MTKIREIKYNQQYIEIESADKYIYKIPNNNSYIRNLLNKAIEETKDLNKITKYFNKCADICILPIWVALVFLIYAIAIDFILLDLIMIICGFMTGSSLLGITVFKLASNHFKKDANNNEYFLKIYEYAKNGGKIPNSRKIVKKTYKTKEIENKGGKKVQNKTTDAYNSCYHLTKDAIIQDEKVLTKKR